ncbi:hypothetical protein FO488_04110 [Geobacter sp. FeAm09]|uniref:hypothetical protein n=1 Tax=Geobacter sp. FeAm09 TaxID=2597769 RepID=UPI0011EE3001|nr:hypothetical protein [Geobacter sp. FeAm09]QEM67409.1 hypothetical protein FO488_04110 [Geobacter sp. FeAm09]
MAQEYGFDASGAQPKGAAKVLGAIFLWIVLAVFAGGLFGPSGLVFVIIAIAISIFIGNKKCALCGCGVNKDTSRDIPDFEGLTWSLRPYPTSVGRICEKCDPEVKKHEQAYDEAMKRAAEYETWPETYKGRIPVSNGSEKEPLKSDWIKGKENAKNQLIITAAYMHSDCNAIIKLRFTQQQESSGNYNYTAWQAIGIPCKLAL